jgi:hypothetical protein
MLHYMHAHRLTTNCRAQLYKDSAGGTNSAADCSAAWQRVFSIFKTTRAIVKFQLGKELLRRHVTVAATVGFSSYDQMHRSIIQLVLVMFMLMTAAVI